MHCHREPVMDCRTRTVKQTDDGNDDDDDDGDEAWGLRVVRAWGYSTALLPSLL